MPQADEFGFGERLAVNKSDSGAKQLSAAYACVANLLETEFTKAADSLSIRKDERIGRKRQEQEATQQYKLRRVDICMIFMLAIQPTKILPN